MHHFKVGRKITQMTQFPPYDLFFLQMTFNDLLFPLNGLQQQNQANQNEGARPRKFQDSVHHMKVGRKIKPMAQFPLYDLLFHPNGLHSKIKPFRMKGRGQGNFWIRCTI